LLAAIANLSNKWDLDIANLLGKVDDKIAALSDKSRGHFNTLSNKIDQVAEKLDHIEDHMLEPQALQAPATAPGAPRAPAQPWSYSAELKARVYSAAYCTVTSHSIEAYTKRCRTPTQSSVG
ncbi:hypothetical protein DFH28DRAFT_885314, partial [Melampsora americana]